MPSTFCFHISTSKIALMSLRFSLESDKFKWTFEAQLHIQSPYLCFNFHYIISFFSHKEQHKKKPLPQSCQNIKKNSRTLKPWNPYYKPPSHYKQAILVTNPYLTTSPVRIKLVWSPWSKGYNHSYMSYRF